MKPDFDEIARLYSINLDQMLAYPTHEGGRNLVYRSGEKIVRIFAGTDRTCADLLAETEYVHYLAQNGADTVDVTASVNGKLVEQSNGAFVSVFTLAKGERIADRGYRYLENVPLEEYFYSTGKVLGKIHALSKTYHPSNRRFDFFEKYHEAYFEKLIPAEYDKLKKALFALLRTLRALPKNKENYGMVHFDFSDGNYRIDYTTGKITVFDFENCRTCFFLYDLANLWAHGVGWVAHEEDKDKRQVFMQTYFSAILAGYRSETEIEDAQLSYLPVMIQTVLMENIIDAFEVQKREKRTCRIDEEQAYRIECMVGGIEFMGFFDKIYDPQHPFVKVFEQDHIG